MDMLNPGQRRRLEAAGAAGAAGGGCPFAAGSHYDPASNPHLKF